ncbi:hypothetical protein CEUSTIGMA_g7580.t1 [Chlamydomonas eustigma]|uniref:Uncharacterized protein n=1 Tax=Chlamydomonas eustigma TaxID=1157962 RepID=A0A250XB89_9CHLO|nr:hypothetical protein CEUSTIGMA_g7580.t1 [Chlamydomonas eustigma]|eukprot:GAX80142.1 hypothetical protein CEUSTIGMA_g7580.t1 [Chlamydomonas eustigma]
MHPPTSDAKWCVEQLFSYLELNFRNRVLGKLGRVRTLEASNLSNLQSYAALAHPSIARASLPSQRSWHNSVPVNISAEQKQELRDTYVYYCGWSERQNYLYMSRTQFLRFCRDTRLMGDTFNVVELSILFEKVHVHSPDINPGVKLNLADWLQALLYIAVHLHAELSPQAAFDKVVEENIVKFAAQKKGSRFEDKLANVVLRRDVIEKLHETERTLRTIFSFYVNQQDLSLSESLRKDSAVYQMQRVARTCMPLEGFQRFGQDFEIVPKLITSAKLCEAFRCSRFGLSSSVALEDAGVDEGKPQSQPEDFGRIGFEEFMDAVGRIALMAFNFKEPEKTLPTLGFNGSYEAAAKSLWLESSKKAKEAELSFPDEVLMPAAVDRSFGIEDRPRGKRDDVLSRAASRAFGCRSGRSTIGPFMVVSMNPGQEVMAVHDEKHALHLDHRPLHLTEFTSDWVGKPAISLTASSRLRKVDAAGRHPCGASTGSCAGQRKSVLPGIGWYSADYSVPTKYLERMQLMVEARINREQVEEALKLTYQAQQRQLDQAKLDASKERRRLLQTCSGQPLVGQLDNSPSPRASTMSALMWPHSMASAGIAAASCAAASMRGDIENSDTSSMLRVSEASANDPTAQRVLEWADSIRTVGSVSSRMAVVSAYPPAPRYAPNAVPHNRVSESNVSRPLVSNHLALEAGRSDSGPVMSESTLLTARSQSTLFGELRTLTQGLTVKVA